MRDFFTSCLVLALLCASAWGGRLLHRRLPEKHRATEALDFVRVVSALLVTFTALVLSLLLSEVNNDFNRTDNDLHTYAAMFITLDAELASLGAVALPPRHLLREYLAGAIASTWPEQVVPPGEYPKAQGHFLGMDAANLGDLLHQAETGIRRLKPSDFEARQIQVDGLSRISLLLDLRWKLVGEARAAISTPLLVMMVLWLMVVFGSFGLTAPKGPVVAACIGMIALSVGGAVFTILELDGPLDGLIKVSSEPMRHALRHLDNLLQADPNAESHL